MKRFVLAILIAISSFVSAQVGIGTTAPNTGAVLDIFSTNKPVILPRMSATAIAAIPNPVPGMISFNITTSRFVGYGISSTVTSIDHLAGSSQFAAGGGTVVGQTFMPAATALLQSLAFYGTGVTSVTVQIRQGEQ